MTSKLTFWLFVGLIYYQSCCGWFLFVDSLELNHLVKPDEISLNLDGSTVQPQNHEITIRGGKS